MSATAKSLAGFALVAEPDGKFDISKIVTGVLGSHDVAIKTAFSAVSIGTELATFAGKLDWGPFPMVTGNAATGHVSGVGDRVTDLAVGDVVYFRSNRQLQRADTAASLNCRSGTHASVAVVDTRSDAGPVRLAPGTPMDVASLTTTPAVGLHSVDVAGVRIGDMVIVIGADLVGLGIVAAAAACGAHVIVSDPRPSARRRAGRFGAQTSVDRSSLSSTVADLTRSRGADIVFETTGSAQSLAGLIPLTRKLGKIVFQGHYGDAPLPFSFMEAHAREISLVFPRVDGQRHTRAAVPQGTHTRQLPSPPVPTTVLEASRAVLFYRDIYEHGPGDIVGAVLDWRGLE